MDKNIERLLRLAVKLIEDGESTIETAFTDAIELENRHLLGIIMALGEESINNIGFVGWNNEPKHGPTSHKSQPYMGMVNELTKSIYNRINS